MELSDFETKDVVAWVKKLSVSDATVEALESMKMIGEELADAERDDLTDEGVSEKDADVILAAVKTYKPEVAVGGSEGGSNESKESKKAPLDLEKAKLERAQQAAEKKYKDLVALKKVMSAVSMPVGYLLQLRKDIKDCKDDKKKTKLEKSYASFIKKRDAALKALRDSRSTCPEGSDNWRAIAEIHEGALQVHSPQSNFDFQKMLTTHTSRVFREQRGAMAGIKDARKGLRDLDKARAEAAEAAKKAAEEEEKELEGL